MTDDDFFGEFFHVLNSNDYRSLKVLNIYLCVTIDLLDFSNDAKQLLFGLQNSKETKKT